MLGLVRTITRLASLAIASSAFVIAPMAAAETSGLTTTGDEQHEFYQYPQGSNSMSVVVDSTSTVVFSTVWPEGDIVTSLISPSGRVIDRQTIDPAVENKVSPTSEVYIIANPEVGTWSVNVFAADVAAEGVSVIVQSFSASEANEPPVAVIQFEQHGAFVTFDGSGSTDADGIIVEYTWDTGDGFAVSGEHATHFYSEPGEYEIVLRVTDDDGESGWASTESFISIPDYSRGGGSRHSDGAIAITSALPGWPAPTASLAGATIRLGFDLGQDWGPDVLLQGAPVVQEVTCLDGGEIGDLTIAKSPLWTAPVYSASGHYEWSWVTESDWTGTCQQLKFYFNDGNSASHTVRFVAVDESSIEAAGVTEFQDANDAAAKPQRAQRVPRLAVLASALLLFASMAAVIFWWTRRHS